MQASPVSHCFFPRDWSCRTCYRGQAIKLWTVHCPGGWVIITGTWPDHQIWPGDLQNLGPSCKATKKTGNMIHICGTKTPERYKREAPCMLLYSDLESYSSEFASLNKQCRSFSLKGLLGFSKYNLHICCLLALGQFWTVKMPVMIC